MKIKNNLSEAQTFLKKNPQIKSFDIVIVADFGHGLIDNEVVKILERAKKLCVNVQTNSGNRGFNLFIYNKQR